MASATILMRSMNLYMSNDKAFIKRQALQHTEEEAERFSREIKECVKNTLVFGNETLITYWDNPNYNTKITFINCSTSNAIQKYYNSSERKVAALNFASYKHPGGGFINGALAQEEKNCHDSFLYNVLSSWQIKDAFYDMHQDATFDGLYSDDTLYSPNVLFFDERPCDIITCAAVNKRVALQKGVPEDEVDDAMADRCRNVLEVAMHAQADTLILGAFGCGVFRNNPADVAGWFRDWLSTDFKGYFREIVFAIPDVENMKMFQAAFQSFLIKR